MLLETKMNELSNTIDETIEESVTLVESFTAVFDESNLALINFAEAQFKEKAKKIWKKIIQFFTNAVRKIDDIIKGRSDKLNMKATQVEGGTMVEMFAGSRPIFKRTIASNEEVLLLNISKLAEVLKQTGDYVDSVAFNENARSENVFDSDFFNENSENVFDSEFFTEAEEKEASDPSGQIYVELNKAYKKVKGSDFPAFAKAQKAVNENAAKLLSATRAISDKALKHAKKEPGQKKLNAYRRLKDVVNVVCSFRSYIKDVD